MRLRPLLRRAIVSLVPALLPLLLGACAITRTVDSTVQSFSTLENVSAQPLTYQLVPLPSQQARPDTYAAVAPLADAALARVGLKRVDAVPQLLAEFTVRRESGYMQGPWYPNGPFGGNWRYGWQGGFGFGYGSGLRGGMLLRDLPHMLYRHEVHLVLRDAASQQTVYETSASNEDVWTDMPAVFGVLFDAALAGFPYPPAGPRTIRLPMIAPAAVPPSFPGSPYSSVAPPSPAPVP